MKGILILVLISLTVSLSKDREAVVKCAKEAMGKPYVKGSKGPNKFDCIGLVRHCLEKIGKGQNIGSVCHYQYKKGRAADNKNPQPGDAVFFSTAKGKEPSHVGIYIGNGVYINANSVEKRVTTGQLSNKKYVTARNFID
jgi:cell wall-associated NlpC family hydrolase